MRRRHIIQTVLLCLAGVGAAAPRHQLNPEVSVGGFSTTLANCDDAVSEFIPRQCTLKLVAVGVVELTATGEGNALEIPLEAMAGSAAYGFDTGTYKALRLRIRADDKVSGTFLLGWQTDLNGKTASGKLDVRHAPGEWVEHYIDFNGEPSWQGELKRLSLRLLSERANVGKSVLIDRIELVADDRADETFGIKPVLMNVIQRVKILTGYRSEWEDIAKYSKETPPNAKELDGRIYYFAKDPGENRAPIYRYFNPATGAYLDDTGPAPAGYGQGELLGHAWTQPYPGMSPVQRVVNKTTKRHALATPTDRLKGYEPDKVLGYAYARSERPLQEYETESDTMDDIFYIESGQVRYGVNLDHGAAGWHWFHGKKQMVNVADFGRQLQLSYYFSGHNPSGVGFGRGQVGNPVVHVHRIGNRLVTRTVPLCWNFKNVLRDEGTISRPNLFPGLVLGTDVTFGVLGHPHVAKWTAYLHTPVSIRAGKGEDREGSQFEIISNHPTADFSYRANIDFDATGKLVITATKENEKKAPDEEMGTLYNYPKSGIGGNISALGPEEHQLAFGLLVGIHSQFEGSVPYKYSFAGEKRVGSSRHVNISTTDKIGEKYASPFNGATTAQRSVMRTTTLPGDNRYTVYIMSGSVAEVKACMQDLYDHRDALEW